MCGWKCGRQRFGGLIPAGRSSRQSSERGGQLRLRDRVEWVQVVYLQPIGGKGAGLIETEDIDMAQRLDGVGLLYQSAKAQNANRAQSIGHGDG